MKALTTTRNFFRSLAEHPVKIFLALSLSGFFSDALFLTGLYLPDSGISRLLIDLFGPLSGLDFLLLLAFSPVYRDSLSGKDGKTGER